MNNRDVNLWQLERIASALDDLLPRVTFVGGCTTVLLVDEAAHYGVRKTDDVDVIVDVATLVEYHRISQRLRELGFREDTDGPNCRWLFDAAAGKLKLDVMPTDEKVLGYANRWFKEAIQEASDIALPNGTVIRVVSPAYLIATKFEAFLGRGKGDFFSHDLEDIVFILENRRRAIIELTECSPALKRYFAKQAEQLLNDDFLNVLPGLLNDPASAEAVENSLMIMRSWG